MTTISIIGAGNMGGSLVGGLINDGHPENQLWVSDPSAEKLHHLKQLFHVQTTTDNLQAAQEAEVIIFAVKPALFAQVATELATLVQKRKPLIISIAAGIREASIQQWLGGNMAIVRTMPNTPALIGSGATALYANPYVSAKQHNTAESILRGVGVIAWVTDEALLDIVTALSGSGPAYFFLIMEILQQTAEQMGLSPDTARLLTLQTALGAARMAYESGKPLDELRKNVTSPGGTTEKAIAVLEQSDLRGILQKALAAAKQRSEELSEAK
jgi:pyrroline-5-carboxylate reductase